MDGLSVPLMLEAALLFKRRLSAEAEREGQPFVARYLRHRPMQTDSPAL